MEEKMWKKRLLVCSALMLILTWPMIALGGIQATYYVSPNGSDSSDGSRSSPFKTLEKARNEVRKINKNMSGDIIIYLLEGTYNLSATFDLISEDSGTNSYNLIYQAYNEKTAVISGGLQIPPANWSLYDSTKNIHRAYVGSLETRQLYVNGKRAIRAQGRMSGFTKKDYGYETTHFNMQYWDNKQDIEIVSLTWWKSYRCGVSDISGNRMIMKQPCWKNSQLHQGFEMENPTWIENAYELLDEEGEWYLNRSTGYLYYKPRTGEDMALATVVVPRLQTLISGTGTLENPIHNIQFRGIVFVYATWLEPNGNDGYCPLQADYRIVGQHDFMPWDFSKTPAHVNFSAAKSILFERNVFIHLGGVAIGLEFGSQNNSIVGNVFRDISGSAIRIGDVDGNHRNPSDARMLVKDNVVDSNDITETAVEYHGSVGIFVGYTEHTEVTHNEIHNLPYTGISVGWGWTDQPTSLRNNKIKFNHIYDVMKMLDDGGGIYVLSRQDGTEIFENDIHDVREGVEVGVPQANHGIYLDNGCSYVTVEHNVLYNISGESIRIQNIGLPAHDNTLINNNTQDEWVKNQAGLSFKIWRWSPEYTPPYHIVADGIGDLGARFIDLNGDGKMDMVFHRWFSGNVQKGACLSTGNGWQWSSEFTPPYHIVADGIGDLGVRFVDVNGDGLVDMVYHRWFNGNVQKGAYLNTGYGWRWAPEFTPPYHIVADGIGDLGARFVDVNGDGLVDMVYHRYFGGNVQKGAYLNTGGGWKWAPEYTPPYAIVSDGLGDLGVRFIDMNGDGRVDIVYHRVAGSQVQKGAYLNTGNGWKLAPEYTPPYPTMADGIGDLGVRFVDVNGDGRVDMVYHRWSNGRIEKGAYINIPNLVPHTGTNWQWSPEYTPPYHIAADGIGDLGARFIDVNGDGLVDMVYHRWFNGNVEKGAYINTRFIPSR